MCTLYTESRRMNVAMFFLMVETQVLLIFHDTHAIHLQYKKLSGFLTEVA